MSAQPAWDAEDMEDGAEAGDGRYALPTSLDYLRHDIARYPLLSREQERALGMRAQAGDLDARNALVLHNMRFVLMRVRAIMKGREQISGLTWNDMATIGAMGLMHAAEKFDPDRGYAFLTYAGPWVRQAFGRALAEHGRIIRWPGWVDAAHHQMRRLIGEYQAEMGDGEAMPPDAWLIAHGAKPGVLRVYHHAPPDVLSLDAPIRLHDGDLSCLAEMIEAQAIDEGSTIAAVEDVEAVERLLDLMRATLTRREYITLVARSGILGRGYTLLEIARVFGVSRERTRQIEARAKERLRVALERQARQQGQEQAEEKEDI